MADAANPGPNSGGRPSKLTSDLVAAMCLLFERGHYRSAVAASVGVHPDTFRRWMKLGRKDSRADQDTAFAGLYRQVMEAEAKGQIALVDRILAAGDADAANFRWLAERRFGGCAPPSIKRQVTDLKAQMRALERLIAGLTQATGPAGRAAPPPPR